MTVTDVTQMSGFQTPGAERKSEFDMQTFLRLLTVQLATQNPLEPMSDRDFFAQLAQLGQVDGISKLQESQSLVTATSMIGKTASGERMHNGRAEQVTGRVEGVVVRSTGTMVALRLANGERVELNLNTVKEVTG
jgi:flagellar hook assembly protein FlgD